MSFSPFYLLHVETHLRQDNPFLLLSEERDLILDEFIRLESRGVLSPSCELCSQEGEYRCVDCDAVQLLCKGCLCRVHSFHPLHEIEVSLLVLCRLPCAVLTR
jgi:hypothetical protein